MAKGTIGALTAVLVWLGAATAAEAQIDVSITGPSRIFNDQTTMQVTATVTGYSSYMYRVKAKINGVTKHDSNNQSQSGSVITWDVPGSQLAMQLWPLTTGTVVEISVKAWVGIVSKTAYSYITIEVPPMTLLPGDLTPSRRPSAVREEAFAWMSREDYEVLA
jgi:hypothetical protein